MVPEIRRFSPPVHDLYYNVKQNRKKRIIKPVDSIALCNFLMLDGVNKLKESLLDLKKYLDFIRSRAPFIPANSLSQQSTIVEMPTTVISHLLIEKFIETDILGFSQSGHGLFSWPLPGHQNGRKRVWERLTIL